MQSNLQENFSQPNMTASSPAFGNSSDNSQTEPSTRGMHIAIIMDGNGRWGKAHGRDRLYGHKMGVKAVRRAIKASLIEGIGMVTLYGFSSDNMNRPEPEVTHFFDLLRHYLAIEVPRFAAKGIRLVVIGRRDRLPQDLVQQIEAAEADTRNGTQLIVRIALDYSARQQILTAMQALPDAGPEDLSKKLSGIDEEWPVDLLIRTSGEQRLSDFLLWECAYAELHFTPTFWPDFTSKHLKQAIDIYKQRDRRFGGVKA